MSLICVVFANLSIEKKLIKENTAFNFTVYLTQVKTLVFFFETHKKKLQQMVKNSVKIIQYLAFFSVFTILF